MKLQKELEVVISGMAELQKEINFQSYIDEIKQTGDYKDLKTRVVWGLFHILCYSHLNLLPKGYTTYLYETYGATDIHIETLLKKAIDTFNLNF